jgi:hypothetical protein
MLHVVIGLFFNVSLMRVCSILNIRGGASLGATGAKPHFIFGDQKKKSGFSKSSSYVAFIIYSKKEGSSMGKLVFGNPLLKYIAWFNIRDNEKQENIGTAFC